MSVIGHVSLGTNDLARACAFYDGLLTLVGLRLVARDEQSLDFGINGILFSLETPVNGRPAIPGNGVHIAFIARERRVVDAFHAEALRRGGRDAGAPGLRPRYGATYYGAFVLDPDGNKIEAYTERAE